nr:MAG TPA: hypothetical protein [Caudoviricetes sp.]
MCLPLNRCHLYYLQILMYMVISFPFQRLETEN